MKITINVNDFLDGLSVVAQCISKKNTLPILDNVRMDVDIDKTRVKLTGADVDMQVALFVPIIEGGESFSACVNAQRLKEILSKLPNQQLTLTFQNGEVVGLHDSGKFTMAYEGVDAYPALDRPFNENTSTHITFANASMLYNALSSVAIGIADDPLRVVMNGVNMDFTEDGFVAVATDGKILLRCIDKAITTEQRTSFILPARPCNILRSLLQRREGCAVNVLFDDKNAQIFGDDFVCSCRRIEGRYPNYESVLPVEFAHYAEVDRLSLFSAVARMLVFAGTQEMVIFNFSADGKLDLRSRDYDYDTYAQETIDCVFKSRDAEFKIALRGTLLQSALRNISCDKVVFKFVDATHGCRLEPAEQGHKRLLHLLCQWFCHDYRSDK